MATPARFYTVKSLAAEWGVSEALVYKLVDSGELGCIRIRRAIRIRPDHVRDYEEAHEQCPDHDISALDTGSPSERTPVSTRSAGPRMAAQDGYRVGQVIAIQRRTSYSNS